MYSKTHETGNTYQDIYYFMSNPDTDKTFIHIPENLQMFS